MLTFGGKREIEGGSQTRTDSVIDMMSHYLEKVITKFFWRKVNFVWLLQKSLFDPPKGYFFNWRHFPPKIWLPLKVKKDAPLKISEGSHVLKIGFERENSAPGYPGSQKSALSEEVRIGSGFDFWDPWVREINAWKYDQDWSSSFWDMCIFVYFWSFLAGNGFRVFLTHFGGKFYKAKIGNRHLGYCSVRCNN